LPTADELKKFNQSLIAEFRANAGQVIGWDSLLLITTLGAKSNQPHTTPLRYSTDGEQLIVVAAAVGAPKPPAWYDNLLPHPDVIVEVGGERYPMHAVIAEGQERERLFRQHTQQVPASLEYQAMTTRQFPIVILERIG
jgi:deazaflavin-dependent oxidoreductase (nitroreductase family)